MLTIKAGESWKGYVDRLADGIVLTALSSLKQIAERDIAEVGRIVRSYFDERDSMEPVSRTELLDRMRTGIVTVLDVRSADEFAASNLPGALNIPLSEREARRPNSISAARLSPIAAAPVAYCRSWVLQSFACEDSSHAALRMDCRNGEPQDCRWNVPNRPAAARSRGTGPRR